MSSETHLLIFSISSIVFKMLVFAECFCQSNLIRVISNFHKNLNIITLSSLYFDQAEIVIDNYITWCPKFGSNHWKPLVAKLQEGVNMMTHPASGQLRNIIASEWFAFGIVELGEVDVTTQQDNSWLFMFVNQIKYLFFAWPLKAFCEEPPIRENLNTRCDESNVGILILFKKII